MVTRKRPDELELIGGNVALDFANTDEGGGRDWLRDEDDLAIFAAHAGLGPPAAGSLERALALRAAVDAVFRALAAGREPRRRDLDALAGAAAGGRLTRAAGGFELVHGDPLGTIAQAAVDLLRTGPLDRLKTCAVCPWLFLDLSRNRSRRWCSMNECGGRLKMRRYRERRATGGR